MTKNDLIYVLSVICVSILFFLIGFSNAPAKTEYIEIPKTVTVTEIKEVPPKADYEYLGEFTVTAYCPYEDEYGNATARPYNIDGHSYIAHDCGGAVKGKVIDIYFDSVEEMNSWGKQVKEVYICRK